MLRAATARAVLKALFIVREITTGTTARIFLMPPFVLLALYALFTLKMMSKMRGIKSRKKLRICANEVFGAR